MAHKQNIADAQCSFLLVWTDASPCSTSHPKLVFIPPALVMNKNGCCLVTGAAGFIGSHVSTCLLQQGRKVIGLDDLSGGFRDHVPAGVKFIEGSITDTQLVKKMFAENKFDYVFHLAAFAAAGLSKFSNDSTY